MRGDPLAAHIPIILLPGNKDREERIVGFKAGTDDYLVNPVDPTALDLRVKALLARAIAQQPRILLLDEPTSHLDLSNKGRILEILRGLSAQGVTILFTTHDPETAIFIARNLVLMRAGQALASGPLETVLTAEKLTATYGVPVRVV